MLTEVSCPCEKTMFIISALSLSGTLFADVLFFYTKNAAVFSSAITFGTVFYHFAMRLAVGYTVNAVFHNRMDYINRWFRERAFERKLYKSLNVKIWKEHIPTYAPENFDLKKHSAEDIIGAMCQAEIVHEIIMLLSLVPIVFTVWFGSFFVFLTTSVIAFMIDSVFVILQKYNRIRLLRLIRKLGMESK